jgi:hypothetical protein
MGIIGQSEVPLRLFIETTLKETSSASTIFVTSILTNFQQPHSAL